MTYDWEEIVRDMVEHFGMDDESAERMRQWCEDHPDGKVTAAEELSMAEYANESSRSGI